MSTVLAALTLAAEKAPDVEGRDIILSMLVVGLIFLGAIILGDVGHRLLRRRKKH